MMVEGALYPIPTLNGTLSGGVRTVIVSPEGEVFLTEPQKEYLKSLILMPGDPLTITRDLTGSTIDNDVTIIAQGESYAATISSTNKDKWVNVTVLMAGVDVTNAVTTRSLFNTIAISIPNVIGNIKITSSVETYVHSIKAKYNKTSATQAGVSKVYDDMSTDDIKDFVDVSLRVYLDDQPTEEIPTSDFTIEGDLTLPERYDGQSQGLVTLQVSWNPKPSRRTSFSLTVYRRTT